MRGIEEKEPHIQWALQPGISQLGPGVVPGLPGRQSPPREAQR